MVSKEHIIKSFDYAIIKCHDYPKASALKYFNEHKENFHEEGYSEDVDTETLPSPVGILQQLQADLQEKVDYKGLEKGVLKDYSTNSFIPLGMFLNNVPDWEDICEFIGYDFGNGFVMPVTNFDRLDSEGYLLPEFEGIGVYEDLSMPQESEILSNMIDKSPRVQLDSVVYRYGELPLDIEVGGHGVFKSFISTSYNPFIALKDIPEGGTWVQSQKIKQKRYKMKMYVPSGTRGIVLNRNVGCRDWQSELLIDKNQRYIVLSRDDVNMTAEVLLY